MRRDGKNNIGKPRRLLDGFRSSIQAQRMGRVSAAFPDAALSPGNRLSSGVCSSIQPALAVLLVPDSLASDSLTPTLVTS
jgi:hypothetical protein